MGVHVAAPPRMHTCERLRAPPMRPLLSRARVGTSAGIYSQRTHVMCLYIYINRCQVGVCKWVRVCVLAYACDRVRALTMREYAACVRVRRALFVPPSIDGTRTGIVYRYMMHACIYIHARLATPTNGSPMRARRTHAPTCCVHVRVRVCACAIGALASAPTHASAFRRRGPRVARLAGVLLGVGVQREHRIVERTTCDRSLFCVR